MSETELHVRTLFGLEDLLAQEVRQLGAQSVEAHPGVRLVTCRVDVRTLYRLHLWSATAIRMLEPLARFPATTEAELYEGVAAVDWCEHLDPDGSLFVDSVVSGSFCTHSQYAAQLCKDAIVDQLRRPDGTRPSVDRDRYDLRLALHLRKNQATIYRNASGESLHRRGYRDAGGGVAPLNEVLAAGIARLVGWEGDRPLVDPFCGSGTLLIEAALYALGLPPGLPRGRRGRFAFHRWPDFDEPLFREVLAETDDAATAALASPEAQAKRGLLAGWDLDGAMVRLAERNAVAAGVGDWLRFGRSDFRKVTLPAGPAALVTNPPYDERLALDDAARFAEGIGDWLKHSAGGYTAWVLSGNTALTKRIGLRSSARIPLRNGPLECRLLRFEVRAASGDQPTWRARRDSRWDRHRTEFAQRLAKNVRHWGRWARRQEIDCYRLYDRDVAAVPLIIDVYGDDLHVAELDRRGVGPTEPDERRHWQEGLIETLSEATGVPPAQVHWKQRRRQKGTQQYERRAGPRERLQVREGGLSFWVDLDTYLDTGLFLDHRQTRQQVREVAQGARVLNLFGYTGSFTVYAAAGGARKSVTVDLSRTYLDWAERNLGLNRLAHPRHQFVCRDTLTFLEECHEEFDLIVLDPPTFSNSKQVDVTFDIQRDQRLLLELTLARLAPAGTLYFSVNRQRFDFEPPDWDDLSVREITRQTVPPDFQRHPPHRCWLLRRA